MDARVFPGILLLPILCFFLYFFLISNHFTLFFLGTLEIIMQSKLPSPMVKSRMKIVLEANTEAVTVVV